MSKCLNVLDMEAVAARAVLCPVCKAAVLVPCRRKKAPHPERVLLARNLYPRLWWDLMRTPGDIEAMSREAEKPRGMWVYDRAGEIEVRPIG